MASQSLTTELVTPAPFLPPEIISQIFEHGSRMIDLPSDGRPMDLAFTETKLSVKQLKPFFIIVSKVCHQWRQLALGSYKSHFWFMNVELRLTLNLAHVHHFEDLQSDDGQEEDRDDGEFFPKLLANYMDALRRSNGCDLHIHFLSSNFYAFDQKADEKLRLFLHGISTMLRYQSQLVIVQANLVGLVPFTHVLNILEQLSQAKSLLLVTLMLEPNEGVVEPIFSRDDVPMPLHFGNNKYERKTRKAGDPARPDLHTFPQSTRYITLGTITADVSIPPNLTHLNIETRTYVLLQDIITLLKNKHGSLEHLSLYGMMSNPSYDSLGLSLPNLRTLRCTRTKSLEAFVLLMDCIKASNTKLSQIVFSIENKYEESDMAIRKDGQSQARRITLHHLTEVHFGCSTDDAIWLSTFYDMPKLEKLYIYTDAYRSDGSDWIAEDLTLAPQSERAKAVPSYTSLPITYLDFTGLPKQLYLLLRSIHLPHVESFTWHFGRSLNGPQYANSRLEVLESFRWLKDKFPAFFANIKRLKMDLPPFVERAVNPFFGCEGVEELTIVNCDVMRNRNTRPDKRSFEWLEQELDTPARKDDDHTGVGRAMVMPNLRKITLELRFNMFAKMWLSVLDDSLVLRNGVEVTVVSDD